MESTPRSLQAALALGLALLAATPASAACKIEQVGEIPVELTRSRILIAASLNGMPVKMILDTGSPFTVISGEAARRAALSTHFTPSGIHVSGVGGEMVPLVAGVRDFTFGSFSLKNSDVFVSGKLDQDGLLGRDMFGSYDIELDLAHGVVRLLRTPGCSDAEMIYWGGKSFAEAKLYEHASFLDPYRTTIQLNGRPFAAILDTGASRTTIASQAAQLAGVGSVTQSGAARGVGSQTVPLSWGVFKSVAIGDESISDAHLRVADIWKYNTQQETGTRLGAIDVDPNYGLIGLDFFRSHRVIISPGRREMLFTYLGGPVFPAPPPPPPDPDPGAQH